MGRPVIEPIKSRQTVLIDMVYIFFSSHVNAHRNKPPGYANVMHRSFNAWRMNSKRHCNSKTPWNNGPHGCVWWSTVHSKSTKVSRHFREPLASFCSNGAFTVRWWSVTWHFGRRPASVASIWYVCCTTSTCSSSLSTKWPRPLKPRQLPWWAKLIEWYANELNGFLHELNGFFFHINRKPIQTLFFSFTAKSYTGYWLIVRHKLRSWCHQAWCQSETYAKLMDTICWPSIQVSSIFIVQ